MISERQNSNDGASIKTLEFAEREKLITFSVAFHNFLVTFLDRLYTLAPDERGYLGTFNYVYIWPTSTSAQGTSG